MLFVSFAIAVVLFICWRREVKVEKRIEQDWKQWSQDVSVRNQARVQRVQEILDVRKDLLKDC